MHKIADKVVLVLTWSHLLVEKNVVFVFSLINTQFPVPFEYKFAIHNQVTLHLFGEYSLVHYIKCPVQVDLTFALLANFVLA